jgi:hypothetical protein
MYVTLQWLARCVEEDNLQTPAGANLLPAKKKIESTKPTYYAVAAG